MDLENKLKINLKKHLEEQEVFLPLRIHAGQAVLVGTRNIDPVACDLVANLPELFARLGEDFLQSLVAHLSTGQLAL